MNAASNIIPLHRAAYVPPPANDTPLIEIAQMLALARTVALDPDFYRDGRQDALQTLTDWGNDSDAEGRARILASLTKDRLKVAEPRQVEHDPDLRAAAYWSMIVFWLVAATHFIRSNPEAWIGRLFVAAGLIFGAHVLVSDALANYRADVAIHAMQQEAGE